MPQHFLLCASGRTLICADFNFSGSGSYGGEGIVSHCESEPAKINAAIASVMIGGICQRSGRR
jgi:hypothetical protein